jgi:hypothetical protein
MLKTGLNYIPRGLLMLALTCVLASCSKKEEPSTATSPTAPVAQVPAAPSAPASPAPEAPASQVAPTPQPATDAGAVLARVDPAETYAITANPQLKGRLGRLIVAFPEGANAGGTRMDVYKVGQPTAIVGGFGNQTLDLLPGTYGVVISGKRVEGVTVRSGHDTKVKVGVLRVTAGGGTRIDVLDPATKQALTGGFGNQQVGLPIGPVSVSVAGQSEPVTIQEGKITDF